MTNQPSRPLSRLVEQALARLGFSELSRRHRLGEVRRAAYGRARAELDSYSDRDLYQDLRIDRAQIHDLAVEEAELAVAAFVRAHPEHRDTSHGRRTTHQVAYMTH